MLFTTLLNLIRFINLSEIGTSNEKRPYCIQKKGNYFSNLGLPPISALQFRMGISYYLGVVKEKCFNIEVKQQQQKK